MPHPPPRVQLRGRSPRCLQVRSCGGGQRSQQRGRPQLLRLLRLLLQKCAGRLHHAQPAAQAWAGTHMFRSAASSVQHPPALTPCSTMQPTHRGSRDSQPRRAMMNAPRRLTSRRPPRTAARCPPHRVWTSRAAQTRAAWPGWPGWLWTAASAGGGPPAAPGPPHGPAAERGGRGLWGGRRGGLRTLALLHRGPHGCRGQAWKQGWPFNHASLLPATAP